MRVNKKFEKAKAEPKPATSLFFYNSIGATPAFAQSRDINFQTSEKFTVEIGYTRTKKAAEQIVDRLNQSGFPIFMTPVQLKSKRVAYKLRMGLFANKKNAVQANHILSERTKYKGKVTVLK